MVVDRHGHRVAVGIAMEVAAKGHRPAIALRQEGLKRGSGAEDVDQRRQRWRPSCVSDHAAECDTELLQPPADIAKRAGSGVADDGQRPGLDRRPSRRGLDGAGDDNEQRKQWTQGPAFQNSGFDFHSASLTSASYSSADIERFA